MNYNKLAEEAHENAVKHGFWETKVSNEHCLMLVITEIAEMVEAHRVSRKDANGTTVESTTWVSVLWYGDGGGLTPHLKRGAKVFVRGRMALKQYQDKNGHWQTAVNCNASEIQLCDIKGNGNANAASAPAAQPENADGMPF